MNEGSEANNDCDCDPADNGMLDLFPGTDSLSTWTCFRLFAIVGFSASTAQQSNDLSLLLSEVEGFEPGR